VDLSVYNILGQHTATLSEGVLPFGAYEVTWDGRDKHGATVASGVYFYRLIADGFTEQKKMVLVR
jgi:flagellar hook assembly protein FlgD